MRTSRETVIVIYNNNNQIVGIVHKGETRTNTFYNVEEMDQDGLEEMINERVKLS